MQQEPEPHSASQRGRPAATRRASVLPNQRLELAAAPLPAAGLAALCLLRRHRLRRIRAPFARVLDPSRLHCILPVHVTVRARGQPGGRRVLLYCVITYIRAVSSEHSV